jgi:hypothetical protein
LSLQTSLIFKANQYGATGFSPEFPLNATTLNLTGNIEFLEGQSTSYLTRLLNIESGTSFASGTGALATPAWLPGSLLLGSLSLFLVFSSFLALLEKVQVEMEMHQNRVHWKAFFQKAGSHTVIRVSAALLILFLYFIPEALGLMFLLFITLFILAVVAFAEEIYAIKSTI